MSPGASRRGVFVTGTDTGVGKTVIAALLCSALRQAGRATGYFKPVQTGPDDDTGTVARLAGLEGEALAAPVHRFRLPAAPSRAAAAEGTAIRIGTIAARWNGLPPGLWVVEGAGGLLVPLGGRETIRDLIGAMGLPILLVASTRLGTINHTLLTLEAARHAGLAVAGVVLNGDADAGLGETILRFDAGPILAEVPPIAPLDAGTVERGAAAAFPASGFATIFGPEAAAP
ncbi:MAG: dethiobiotin synthase [Candidatus Polarisedimenticolia bacterium]